jgi:serine/threonine protein phosphatase PrpC
MKWSMSGATSAKDGTPWAVLRGDDLALAVADAAGSWGRGYEACRIAPALICAALGREGTPAERLKGALDAVSREVSRLLPEPDFGADFSAVAALACDDGVHVAWAGACGALWLRGGTPLKATKLRTLLDELIASGRWAPEDAGSFPHPNVMMTALGLGAEHPVHPDLAGPWRLEPGDALVLGSQSVVDLAARGSAADAEALIDEAYTRSPIERSLIVVHAA